MAYVRTVPVEQAQGPIKAIYDEDLAASGIVQNYAQALSLRPDILRAYRGLSGAIRSGRRARRGAGAAPGGVYRRLAEVERRHAQVWSTRIADAGGRVPAYRP